MESMSTLIALPNSGPHAKTIDLRQERLERAIAQATGIYTHQFTPDRDYKDRVLAVLLENKALLAAHIRTLIDDTINTTPAHEQLEQLRRDTHEFNDLLLRADLATTQLRHHLAGNDNKPGPDGDAA